MQPAVKNEIIAKLNEIMKNELAGAVRYTHYALMVFGFSRIPVVSWFRNAANESIMHANEAGEMITTLGGHPTLEIGELLETHKHDMAEILKESVDFEMQVRKLYKDLMHLSEGVSVTLEEYARRQIAAEAMHISEIDKMLRRPGDIEAAVSSDPQ